MKRIQNLKFEVPKTVREVDFVRSPQVEVELSEGNYLVRFARTSQEIDAALRLRFEVFNLELSEGLRSSYLDERDEDEFDATAQHLICVEKTTNQIIGTYRLQTWETAKKTAGFYTSTEFKVADFPLELLSSAIELGRACIAREHRHTKVLFLLWKGLAKYALLRGKRYFFGCCSLSTQDVGEGFRAARLLEDGNHLDKDYWIAPCPDFVCQKDNFSPADKDYLGSLPKLFQTYLRFGAKVCSPPAIDREFGTIDFLVLFDLQTMDAKIGKMFFYS